MINIVDKVSEELNIPRWWVESIAIEYLDCRDYDVGENGIWKFNYEKVTKDELIKAVNEKKAVISAYTIFHNVRSEILRTRMLEGLVSNVIPGISENEGDILVEGLASNNYIPFLFNPTEEVDPKQNLSFHFQVFDDGRIWQWKFADFISVEGRNYGKFISEISNLDGFDKLHDMYLELYNNKKNQTKDEFLESISEYFDSINTLREKLLGELLQYHYCKKNEIKEFDKVTDKIPPYLSRFETFKVKNGEFYTRCYAAPIFYRGCYDHSKKSKQIEYSIKEKNEYVTKLDSIYQNRAIAVIMGASCLESFINQLGYECFPNIWDDMEKLSIGAKYLLFFELNNKSDLFDVGKKPFSYLNKLIRARNMLVHFKPHFKRVKNDNNSIVTTLNYYLNAGIDTLPEKIRKIIEITCRVGNKNSPAWLYDAPGWRYE